VGRVEGKVAFITGVARGQGRSHAVRLAEEGADIIGVDVCADVDTMPYPMGTQDDLDETARLVEKTGRQAILSRADVRDRDALQQALGEGVAALGRLDIVCANAGISPPGGPVWTIPPQQWRDVIDINLTGVFNTLAVAVPAMQAAGNGGAIIVTASGAGLRSAQNLGDYNASKHAVVGLAQTLANEVAKQGIRVNVIAPGTVNTPMVTANDVQFKVFRPDLADPKLDDCIDIFKMIMPMGHPWVDPADISNAVVFLASDEARYVTGIVMPVDQGSNNRVF
jgi:SDR family mycofactocin-dependent oxidoreductase